MSISVLTTNVFPGQAHVEALIRCLAAQTYQDFEWVLVDAFHEANRDLVNELAARHGLRQVLHTPICTATHVGRQFSWDTYNTAMLLAANDLFLRVGVFRYIHQRVVELAVKHGADNTWLSLRQRDVPSLDSSWSHAQIDEKHGLEADTFVTWDQMISHCGMFSFRRQLMLEMGGNNEALTIHHWEDVDLNCRWTHLGKVKLISLENAMLRIYHSKDNPYVGKKICASGPRCIAHAANSHELERTAHTDTEWTEYRGFPWARCRDCGAVAVGYCDKYFEYLKRERKAMQAPVGVFGTLGRNIRVLHEDLGKLSALDAKLELLAASHTSPRYLQE